MKKELISFKTAKLAKEVGFDEKCSHYYVLDFQSFKADGVLHKTGLPNDWDNSNILQFVKRTNQPHLAPAPTQSLLQRWLREKHNIDIIVKPWSGDVEDTKKYAADVCIFGTTTYIKLARVDTYEEALEQGLLQALKLIKK